MDSARSRPLLLSGLLLIGRNVRRPRYTVVKLPELPRAGVITDGAWALDRDEKLSPDDAHDRALALLAAAYISAA